jgi:hypothetical protein
MAQGTEIVAFKIPQGGHSVVAAVTVASLLLVGAAALTLVMETPLTQALAAAPSATAHRSGALERVTNDTPERARLAKCACDRWRKAATHAAGVDCAVDELVISPEWVVARLNLRTADPLAQRPGVHAVEVMHLIDGHVDEDWHLASTHEWR